MNGWDWAFNIVPLEIPGARQPAPAPAQDYTQPWYVDTINRAIERAAQVATIQSAGYPQIPTFPAPPTPIVTTQQQPSGAGIQLSTNTLMILGLVGLAFIVGGRRR